MVLTSVIEEIVGEEPDDCIETKPDVIPVNPIDAEALFSMLPPCL